MGGGVGPHYEETTSRTLKKKPCIYYSLSSERLIEEKLDHFQSRGSARGYTGLDCEGLETTCN